MNITRYVLLILVFSLQFQAYAEEKQAEKQTEEQKPNTFEESIPSWVLNDIEDSFFTITDENDFFGGGTDKNYTNGIMLTWFNRDVRKSKIAEFVADIIPNFDIDGTTSVYYSIGHNLYTPERIDIPIPDTKDRPYAAFLYGSVGFTDIEDNHIDDIEITLGVIGPMAFGEEIQVNYHSLIETTEPKGWDYQLENELGLMFSWQRRWPEAFAVDTWGGGYFRIMPHVGATIGNIYTYTNAGFNLQFVPKKDRWQSQPLRVRPAIPGSGFFSNFEDGWSWMLFAGVEGRVIARNIFLDGNTFEDSPSVDKRYFVADANAGLAMSYKSMRISYTVNWRSEEFRGQDESHLFGALSLGFRF